MNISPPSPPPFHPSLSFCPQMLIPSQTRIKIITQNFNMKATTIITALALALVPAASAWHLQLYSAELYGGDVVVDREGSLDQPCKTLAREKDNVVSSMHWYAGFWSNCAVELYEQPDCTQIIAASQEEDWNIPNFSTKNNDKTSSYLIRC